MVLIFVSFSFLQQVGRDASLASCTVVAVAAVAIMVVVARKSC